MWPAQAFPGVPADGACPAVRPSQLARSKTRALFIGSPALGPDCCCLQWCQAFTVQTIPVGPRLTFLLHSRLFGFLT